MYLPPRLKLYQNKNDFKDFKEEIRNKKYSSKEIERIDFEHITQLKIALILGEAGLGKSRLLEEVFKEFRDLQIFCCDLKKIKGDISNYIREKSSLANIQEPVEDLPFYHTQDFKLIDNENILIGLDALDEVNENLVHSTIKAIKKLRKQYPKIKIFISSRTHHLLRNFSLFNGFDTKILELSPLSPFDITQYIKHHFKDINDRNTELISLLGERNIYHYYSSNNIIAIPRYLEIFVELAKEYGFQKVLKIPRSKLIHEFITHKLRIENQKGKETNYRSKQHYIYRILRDLALTLEVQRTNQISKEEFLDFLYDNGHQLSFQIPFEDFWHNTILKDNGDILEFENTEFQEFLAAQALTKIGRIEQVIFDVAVEQHLKDIYPNWKDVIAFLIELEPNLLLPILQFSIRNKRLRLFNFLNHLEHDFVKNNATLKEEIFDIVLNFHVQEQELFRNDLEKGLAKFYIPRRHGKKLKQLIQVDNPYETFPNNFNGLLLLKELLKSNIYFSKQELQNWKEVLLKMALSPVKENRESLQRIAVEGLEWVISTIEEAELLGEIYGKQSNLISNAIIDIYQRVEPNHPKSIDLYFRDLERNQIDAIYHFDYINTTQGFISFFEMLLQNAELYAESYTERHLFKLKKGLKSQFQENLEACWNEKIEELVLATITQEKLHFITEKQSFVKNLLDIFTDKDENVVFKIVRKLQSIGKLNTRYSNIILINETLQVHQIEKLKSILEELDADSKVFKEALIYSHKEEIRAISKVYFPEEHKNWQAHLAQKQHKKELQEASYDYKTQLKFKKFIEELNQNDFHSIWFFKKQADRFKPLFSKFQKRKFHNLIIKLLNDFTPYDDEAIDEKYYVSSIFYAVINLSDWLKIDLKPYREKLIKLLLDKWNLPLEDGTLKLFEILAPLSPEEEDLILQIVIHDEDFQKLRLDRLIRIFKHFEQLEAEDLFKKLIDDDNVGNFYRTQLIELVTRWNYDKDYLLSLFEKYNQLEDNESNFRILVTINSLLLANHDLEAFDWLFEQLKKYKYTEIKDLNSKSSVSIVPERRGNDLYRNLEVITSPNFRAKMIELIHFSIEILDDNYQHEDFVSRRMWHAIDRYFQGLTQNKPMMLENLSMLNKCIKSYANSNSARLFQYRVEGLHHLYLKELSKPIRLFDSIKIIKNLKQKKYLDISSVKELFDLVVEVLKGEFRYKIEKEGFDTLITDVSSTKRETFIQKVCIPMLQNMLIKRGLRISDFNDKNRYSFYREPQTDDDKRIDILLTYGAVGNVMIEIKREQNKSGFTEKYKTEKFLHYMQSMNSSYGIYLIFGDGEDKEGKRTKPDNFQNILEKVTHIYKNDWNIEIIGIDCLGKTK